VINANNQDNFPLMAPIDTDSINVTLPEWDSASFPTPSPTINPSPEPQSEPFPTATVATVSVALAAVVVAAGLLVCFKKHQRKAVCSRNLYLKNGVSSETFTKTFFRQEKIRWVEDSS
jgi:hypothetical protein